MAQELSLNMKEQRSKSHSGNPCGSRSGTFPALLVVAAFVAGLALMFLLGNFSATAQTRKRRSPAAPPRVDYSKFSHTTDKHRGQCLTCHKSPTQNWRRVRDYPDVTDYPGHAACVSCHRRQFFKGANPEVCLVCHLKSSPRDDRRYAFRNPASSRQFSIEFPHDKHQDVIARLRRPSFETATTSQPRFTKALFSIPSAAFDSPAKAYNNCTICHSERPTPPGPPAGGWVDSFSPDAATFKSVPLSHASCFNCHWKSQPPISTDCAGCHKNATPHISASGVERISMKFRHAREQHVAECTTCHINITKSATLRGLKPDVPITSCTECHNKDGLRLDVSKELEAIDKNKDFVCVYCHTSNIGRQDPPSSHYLIAGREPLKRQDIK